MKSSGFIIVGPWVELLSKFTLAERNEVIVESFGMYLEERDCLLHGPLAGVCEMIVRDAKAKADKFEDIGNKMRNNGKKGGRPKTKNNQLVSGDNQLVSGDNQLVSGDNQLVKEKTSIAEHSIAEHSRADHSTASSDADADDVKRGAPITIEQALTAGMSMGIAEDVVRRWYAFEDGDGNWKFSDGEIIRRSHFRTSLRAFARNEQKDAKTAKGSEGLADSTAKFLEADKEGGAM